MRIYRELGGHFLCLHARALHAAPEKRPPTCFTTPSRGSDVLSQNRRRQTYVCMLRGRRKNLSLPMAEIPPPLATTTTRALRGKRVAAGGGLPGTYPSKHVCSWWPTTEHNHNSLLRGILEKTKKKHAQSGREKRPLKSIPVQIEDGRGLACFAHNINVSPTSRTLTNTPYNKTPQPGTTRDLQKQTASTADLQTTKVARKE